jgi:uroporphyrinogen-III synthase
MRMRLLVTRPEPDAQRTATTLRGLGHETVVAPLLRIEGVAADFGAGPWDGVVMTSANSCRASANHPRRDEVLALPVFVVGRYSADTARSCGFTDVTSADGDGKDLARLLVARFGARERKLLYLAGEDRAADLAAELAALGIPMKTVVIYRAVKVGEFAPPARKALEMGEIDGALHFSRRTAEAYLSCAVGAGLLDKALGPFHYCLSPQVARPLLQTGAATVRVAARPDEAGLIELVGAAR